MLIAVEAHIETLLRCVEAVAEAKALHGHDPGALRDLSLRLAGATERLRARAAAVGEMANRAAAEAAKGS